MNKTFATLTTACFAAVLVLGGATVANATNDKNHKVTICHATSSSTNPWVTITVARAALKAHEGHADLIPAPPGGCPVPEVVVPPVDVPVDPIDPPTEEPVDPPVDVPEETTPETPVGPPYTPPVVDCAEGTVPGILNEQGDPTACVSNDPCPGFDVCPVDEPEVPVAPPVAVPPVEPTAPVAAFVPQQLPTLPVTELAYTGSSPLVPAGIASLLLAVGGFLLSRKVRA
jgi:hypothetical protein